METFYFEKLSELKQNMKLLQTKLEAKLILKGKQVTIEGEALQEYTASRVLEAMQFGFSAKNALLLIEPETSFQKINIKHATRRKNRYDVRARIIGKEGKTKRTIESVSGCAVIINGNEIGLLGPAEVMDDAVLAVQRLVKGSKEANVYNYLERRNTQRKKLLNETLDLGLKIKEKDEK